MTQPRVRRRVRRPPDLTSLFDVLFIVVFVALIRAAAAQQAAETPPPIVPPPEQPRPPPQPPQPPPDVAALRTRALATFGAELAARTPLVIRVAIVPAGDASAGDQAAGSARISGIEADGKRLAVDIPLLELSADPDIEVAYLGDRSADLRLCRVAALRLAVPDLARYLVIVSPDRPLSDGKHALRDGLLRDLDRCFSEQRGLATIVPPAPPEPSKKKP